jgi:hypothetical protein
VLDCALIVNAVLNKTNCLFIINADLSLNLLKENGRSYYLNLCENYFKFALTALKSIGELLLCLITLRTYQLMILE